jgi:hypothetical protein
MGTTCLERMATVARARNSELTARQSIQASSRITAGSSISYPRRARPRLDPGLAPVFIEWALARDSLQVLERSGARLISVDPETLQAASSFPRCPRCGGMARPNVLLFGDDAFVRTRRNEQRHGFLRWLAGTQDGRLVIVELGAGTGISNCSPQRRGPGTSCQCAIGAYQSVRTRGACRRDIDSGPGTRHDAGYQRNLIFFAPRLCWASRRSRPWSSLSGC